MKKLLPALLALLLFALAGCGTAYAPELLEPAVVDPDTAVVYMGEIADLSCVAGWVVPEISELSFTADGRVGEIAVYVGCTVEEGQVLARLDVSQAEEMAESLRDKIELTEKSNWLKNQQSRYDIELAELGLQGLEGTSAERQQIQIESLKNSYSAQTALQELELRGLRSQLEEYERVVAAGVVTSDCAGTVVSIDVTVGGWARAYSTCIRVANDSTAVIKSEYISSGSLAEAKEIYATVGGRRAEIENVPYGRAEYLALSSANALDSRFRMTEPPEDVEIGMAAYIYIINNRAEDALIVPSNAVRREGAELYVYLVSEDGSQRRQTVEVGIETVALAQITSGLKEGDVVYVGN